MSIAGTNEDDIPEIDNISITQSEASTSKLEFETDKYGFMAGKESNNREAKELSVEKVRERESKWLLMLDNWDKWISKQFIRIKKRCRKGIPSSLRGRAWQLLCGSKQLQAQNESLFQNLLVSEAETQVVEDIEKDLHRQFPFHEMFSQKGGTGQQDLRDILYAYAIYNKKDGYCQAQAPVAAVLLMHMPAEEAFWCMVALFEFYIPGYYSPGLEAVQMDGDVMQSILRHVSSTAFKQLDVHNVSPMLYSTEWLMCIFSRTLPWPCVLRLWDMFFCEGIKIVFRCALIILKNALGKSDTVKKLPGMYETLEYVKKFDMKDWNPDDLIHQIVELRIEEDDLDKEYKRQIKIRLKQNPQAKVIRRRYKYVPTHNHRKGASASLPTRSKKKLSTISVNTPHMMAQAIEHEQHTMRERAASRRQKASSNPVLLTDYRRYSDITDVTLQSNDGDVASSSSSGTSFLTINQSFSEETRFT